MAKRKHAEYLEDALNDTDAAGRELYNQKKLCAQRINNGQKALYNALKLAAGFERQKTSRRKKTAAEKKDTAGLARIEGEYQVLKALNYAAASESHLYKTLLKVKLIASHPAVPFAIQNPPKLAHDAATLNVLARLYKANPVRKVIDEVIADLKKILESSNISQKATSDTERANVTTSKRGVNDEFSGGEGEEEEEEEEEVDAEHSSGDIPKASADEDSFNGFSESGSDSFAELNARIAESSDDESEDEEADDTFSSDNDIPAPKPTALENPSKKSKAFAKPSTSTFLPSLTMGGYMSGSESEAEDDIDVAPRKNRRGQRARQQIWEKKYGAKAKHVENKKGDGRNQGWDPKKGATLEGGKPGRGGKFQQGQRFGKPKGTDANSVEVASRVPKKRDDTGALHPSWQAAKLAKEKKQSASFAGKKISFD